MPNRIILVGAALFLLFVIGFISSPRTGSKVNSDQDFTIHIPPKQPVAEAPTNLPPLTQDEKQEALASLLAQDHLTISSSKMGAGKHWFAIDFLGHKVTHPNVLPHPHPLLNDQLMVIANEYDSHTLTFKELGCAAKLANNTLKCIEEPLTLPVPGSVSDKCSPALDTFNYVGGPRELRIAYGPDRPYAVWGAPSSHTCIGTWMQDLHRLFHWEYSENLKHHAPFFLPADLQRPDVYAPIEKDWFVFWDRAGEMFIHYNTAPQRHFAKINATAGIGFDLAGYAVDNDQACIAKHFPTLTHTGWEHIQQASNALMVTQCDREDPTCFETEHNTFIMSIINHQTSFQNDLYEPYVMLFRRTPPFELHGISKLPLWINGREKPAGLAKTEKSSLAVHSIHWKSRGNNYQGYLNNELLIGFTVDGTSSGVIDVMAADFLDISNFNLCI